MYPRRQRFTRSHTIPRMELTERDREVLRLVLEHRFLNSRQIVALSGANGQAIIRRLHLLYHHRYLERPRCQLDYYYLGGSRPMVYALADKGAEVLRRSGITIKPNRPSEKNRSVSRPYLEHALFVADVMIAIELACRDADVAFLGGHELIADTSLRWRTKLNDQTELGLLPDSAFSIEYQASNGATDRAYFFLEADRGTMPIDRKDLALTSIYRKLLAYQATWQQNLHQALFGFHRFRVLIVTTSPERMQGVIDCCSRLKHGLGLFLFADRSILEKPKAILSAKWHTSKRETATLLG